MANVPPPIRVLVTGYGMRAVAFGFCIAVLAAMGVIWMNSAAAPAEAAPAQAVPASAGLIGWLDVVPKADPGGKGMHLTIEGRAFALAEVNGRYTIDVRRRGRGGVSNSRQSGVFTIAPGETAALSRTTINAQAADRLEIELRLFEGKTDVFSVTMHPSVISGDGDEEDAAGKRTL